MNVRRRGQSNCRGVGRSDRWMHWRSENRSADRTNVNKLRCLLGSHNGREDASGRRETPE